MVAVRHVRLSHAFARARGAILAVGVAASDLHAVFLHRSTWQSGQDCEAGLDSGKSGPPGAVHAVVCFLNSEQSLMDNGL